MIKAIFFDIDGTLVPMGKSNMIESSYKAIKLLQKKGIKCVICSGRDFREVNRGNDVLDRIKFDGIIASTGQYCADGDGNPFYVQSFDDAQTKEVVSLFNEKKYTLCLKTEFGSYVNFLDSISKDIFEKYDKKAWDIKQYQGEKIFQAMLYIKREEIKDIKGRLKSLAITSWHPLMADLIPCDGGKAKGIKKFLEKENIEIADTMAFGDSENDIDMLKCVNIGVAMGNSSDTLKGIADYICENVEDDGIYRALKHFGLI